jgi:CBS domain-containing protein
VDAFLWLTKEANMMNTVRHILQVKGSDTWFIGPDDTVYEALRRMADKDVGALLVMEGEKLVGILSERDYARKVVLMGKTSKDTPVHEIMSREVYTIHPDQTTEECMQLMNNHHIRHVPVVDENNKVMGVVSIGDVVRSIIHRQRETIKDLESRRAM